MLTLRAMSAEEFPAFQDYFLADYAAEISENYLLPQDAAALRAASAINSDLPQGVATPQHHLRCICLQNQEVVGYLWYQRNPAKDAAFLNDFHIFPASQRQGFGRQSLALLRAELAAQGVIGLDLRVAASNLRAQRIYTLFGFAPTGINMTLRL